MEVARAACSTLRYLSFADDNAAPLVRAGAHVAVAAVAVVHAGDVLVARAACGTLLNLSRSSAAECRVGLVCDGAYEFLRIACDRHPADATVQDYCRRAGL